MQIHKNPGEQGGEDKDPNRRHNHGLSGGVAYALRPTGGSESVETANQRDHEGENERLEKALRNIVVLDGAVSAVPILGSGEADGEAGDCIAADQAHEIRHDG